MTKRRDELSEGWEVEWCASVPLDDIGELDLDNAKYLRKDFHTEAEAVAFAKTKLPDDFFGAVQVTRFHSERYEPNYPGTFREYDGETQYIDGESENA